MTKPERGAHGALFGWSWSDDEVEAGRTIDGAEGPPRDRVLIAGELTAAAKS
ncbi:hypothetical protein AB0N06_10585 [Streptomyces sp. NPDC051020]|uniref:hypothetical protein n=1 Tax=Streptomyces sp. NPDC051020 TaxID=3155409 RepID=UPI0034394994